MNQSLKVRLQIRKDDSKVDKAGEHVISWALPYYQSKPGAYVHRVRSGRLYSKSWTNHAGFQCWCGMSGTIEASSSSRFRSRHREKARLMAEVPPTAILCATCEGRAIGAGQDGSRLINGRMTCFRPRDHGNGPQK